MEFLRIKVILLILFLGAEPLWAQVTQETLEKAFARSYELEKTKDFSGSVETLKKVYDQSSYEINLRLGWLYYNTGQFSESVTFYSLAQELKPYSEEARFGLILPKAALGDWNAVIELYNEILEIHPNNTVAMFRLGMIYYERKNYDKAMPLFKKVVDLYPFDYDGLLMLAWTSYFTGNFNQARILFNKVKLYSPGDNSANEGLQLMR
ncbi:tetratricopeptide repeat protein [Mariniphaga sediminis]|jgi:tetratricopeptide (TPR) repeat protein|uniref:Tetratricopeptide repeat protein n=1 Tax=Mariniphaga sediminis TaxID=1628158 RepID=A0A399D6W5_9BACT|nr:tetratricopeptide repeat protein [Mariniphaga sediminis]RIH66352.1 tetratricopeptide repeat protein [Mariniphaga sediminis]